MLGASHSVSTSTVSRWQLTEVLLPMEVRHRMPHFIGNFYLARLRVLAIQAMFLRANGTTGGSLTGPHFNSGYLLVMHQCSAVQFQIKAHREVALLFVRVLQTKPDLDNVY